MACSLGNGWKQDRHQEAEAEAEEMTEEEEECERHMAKNGKDSPVGSMEQWDLSFSQENLEDAGLLEDLRLYQDHPAEGEQTFDLSDLHDFVNGGEAMQGSPPPGE